jgi:hypothetical protein
VAGTKTSVTAARTDQVDSLWGMRLQFNCLGSLITKGPTSAPSSPTPAPSPPTQAPTDASQHVITATGTGKQIETIAIPVRIEHVYGHVDTDSAFFLPYLRRIRTPMVASN